MRNRVKNDGLSVHAIAGTRVVLLGMDIDPSKLKGLMGFQIRRTSTDPRTGQQRTILLSGGKRFREAAAPAAASATGEAAAPAAASPVAAPAAPPPAQAAPPSSDRFPIQSFMWGDYTVEPATAYRYEVTARYGTKDALTDGAAVSVEVTTETNDVGESAVFFNRGVAGSAAYVREFADKAPADRRAQTPHEIRPADVPNRAAYVWLSRGLEEAMLAFIRQARGPGFAIHGAAYELTYRPALDALLEAQAGGAEVRLTYHAKPGSKDSTTVENKRALDELRQAQPGVVDQIFIPRTRTAQFSHNKFLILLENGRPTQVWTGSTNFTEGGIFGQSNVGQIIRDPDIAAAYHAYWSVMKDDPAAKKGADALDAAVAKLEPDLSAPPQAGVTAVFSPRPTDGMLDWYAARMGDATSSVHFTAPFGVAKQFLEVAAKDGGAPLRYFLLDNDETLHPRPGRSTAASAGSGAASAGSGAASAGAGASPPPQPLDHNPRNRIAWGDVLRPKQGEAGQTIRHVYGEGADQRVKTLKVSANELPLEVLTGLNTHVRFVHIKCMLVDPLSDDPIVMNGSANFSHGSTVENDENMLIIRGDKRLADIFLGEFMRLFNHFRIRNEANAARNDAHAHLAEDDTWTAPYFDDSSQLASERRLFA